jgi:hypothetical protein
VSARTCFLAAEEADRAEDEASVWFGLVGGADGVGRRAMLPGWYAMCLHTGRRWHTTRERVLVQ